MKVSNFLLETGKSITAAACRQTSSEMDSMCAEIMEQMEDAKKREIILQSSSKERVALSFKSSFQEMVFREKKKFKILNFSYVAKKASLGIVLPLPMNAFCYRTKIII
jgi:hypothetical protein